MKMGDHLTLSAMETTLHVGAHADAPSHYHVNGDSIEKRELEIYFGLTQVITCEKSENNRVNLNDLKTQKINSPRVLLKTGTFPDPNVWSPRFKGLSVELINAFSKQGVKLIGIDTPSIDPADSKDLPAHNAVYKSNLAILEGLNLNNVSDGKYFLSALPLSLKGADASPVRAALWDLAWLHNETSKALKPS